LINVVVCAALTLLWATDTESDLQEFAQRLRAYDPAVFSRLRPNVGVNDDRLGSSVVMLGDGSDGFVAGDLGGVGGS
jgi:hypothetical protein